MDHDSCMDTSDGRRAVVVIDGANVAAAHARILADAPASSRVIPSLAGLMLAVQWFRARGHADSFAFIPAYWFSTGPGRAPFQSAEWMAQAAALVREGWAVGTPPSESDDLWIIEYAVQRSGWVCSNDLFRDHLSDRARRFGPGEAATLSAFIDEHVIPYAWRSATEFLPQPVKARAALLAPRPPTPDVVHAAALLPPGVTEALAAARRPPMPHDAAPVSRVPLPLLVTPSVGAWDDGDADMLPVDAPAQALAAVSSEASRCATEQAPFSRAEDLPAHLSRVVAAVFGSTRDTRVALTPVPAVLPSPSTLAAVIGACAEVYDRAWVAVTEAGYTAETRAAAAEKLAAAVLPTPLWSAAREALLLSVSRARQPWHATAPG